VPWIEETAMRITLISPDESVKETDEHLLSDSLLESAVSGKSTERISAETATAARQQGHIREEWDSIRNIATHRKVSLRIFSLTSQGPLATYSRNVSAGKSLTLSRIFHVLYRNVGS
jgi:hypothetical protein